jgi:hypothetical protein
MYSSLECWKRLDNSASQNEKDQTARGVSLQTALVGGGATQHNNTDLAQSLSEVIMLMSITAVRHNADGTG